MRFVISLLILAACFTTASAEQKNCDKMEGSKLTGCLNENIKDLNATISMLKSGFTLALSGQKSKNQCVGIETDTGTSPIMIPCAKNNALETWTIAPAK